MSPRGKPRLRLHRETLRTLGPTQLVRVAGGTDAAGEMLDPLDPIMPGQPRTNAWTAREGAGVLVCGGAA